MSTILPATGNKAGQIEPIGEVRTFARATADNATAFVRGDVLANKTSKWFKAVAADKVPFAVCINDKALTSVRVEAVDQVGVEVSVVADGAITPESFVKVGPAAGRVQAWVSGTDATELIVGRYIKRAQYVGEGDGQLAAPSAAQNDIIIIRLGKQ
jgi:hypothetical protein